MADDAIPDEAPITFNVKSSSDAKYVITLPLNLTVLELKQKLSSSEYADIPPERQRLIYSGRVLKDPDTLASYKIKEGNTVHLVKGAASNQRQNPASQGSNTTPGSTGSATASTGVPTNIAAGTGNNPLAGLTGARYAGFAQLPGAGMFGPDGGMGPPPDPEHMINMLQDPNFASTLDEALQNPALIEQMIQNNPMLRGMGPQVRQAMQNPAIRRMMTDPEMMRQATQMQRQMGGGMFGGGGAGEGAFPMPGATDTTPGQAGERTGAAAANTAGTGAAPTNPFNPFAMLGNMGTGQGEGVGAAGGNPFAALFQPPSAGTTSTNTASPPAAGGQERSTDANQQAQQPQPPPPANPFAAMAQNPMMQSMLQNPQLMQQMMQSMMGGSPSNEPTPQQAQNPFAALFGGPAGGFGAAAAPPDTRPPEERYEEQLRQLNDMGFYEFERNVEALRRSGGSVQGAVEYLLTH
ncbi:MAG: hypothetical protein Q9195_000735 [Heterodermia aff. obscurata]